VSIVKSNYVNNSNSFSIVQFLAGLGDPMWGFNQLPSASVFSYNKVDSWNKANVGNHTGNEDEFDVRTVFASIIQFGDTDGDGIYNPKKDQLYQTCRLNNVNYGMGFSQSMFHPGNVSYRIISLKFFTFFFFHFAALLEK
jgi:hypothetical protein